MEEINRTVRQSGVASLGGVEHVGLGARTLHETGDWSLSPTAPTPIIVSKARRYLRTWPTITALVAKCYGTRPADVGFRMRSGETRKIACSDGVAGRAEAFQK